MGRSPVKWPDIKHHRSWLLHRLPQKWQKQQIKMGLSPWWRWWWWWRWKGSKWSRRRNTHLFSLVFFLAGGKSDPGETSNVQRRNTSDWKAELRLPDGCGFTTLGRQLRFRSRNASELSLFNTTGTEAGSSLIASCYVFPRLSVRVNHKNIKPKINGNKNKTCTFPKQKIKEKKKALRFFFLSSTLRRAGQLLYMNIGM